MRINNDAQVNLQNLHIEDNQIASENSKSSQSLPSNQLQNSPVQPQSLLIDSRAALRQMEMNLPASLKVKQLVNQPATDTQTRSNSVTLKQTSTQPISSWQNMSSRLSCSLLGKKVNKNQLPLGDAKGAVDFIKSFNSKLGLSLSDLQLKFKNMAGDTGLLFRSMPSLFYKDIQGAYGQKSELLNRPAPQVMIQGDMHLDNFGTFRGSDGHAVWGINDFDKIAKGSPEWDLERLSTSIVLDARKAGLSDKEQQQLIKDLAKSYLAEMKDLATGNDSGPAFLTANQTKNPITNALTKADSAKQKDLINKYTSQDSAGNYHFLTGSNGDRLTAVAPERAQAIKTAIASYESKLGVTDRVARPLNILDIGEKPDSGGSSFGLNRYFVLVAPANPDKQPIILEMKEVLASPVTDQSGDLTHADAQIIVDHEHLLDGNIDPLTGATRMDKNSYLIRDREPEKGGVDATTLSKNDFEQLVKQAGQVLARVHGRTPDQAKSIVDWVKNDDKKLISNLTDFAISYANQTEADRQELMTQIS